MADERQTGSEGPVIRPRRRRTAAKQGSAADANAKPASRKPGSQDAPSPPARSRVKQQPRGWQRLLLGASDENGYRGLRLLVVGFGLLAVLVIVLLIVRGPGGRRPHFDLATEDDPTTVGFGAPTQSYSLYFIDSTGSPVAERREVTMQASRTEQIRVVVEELLAGSVSGHGAALPSGTRLRNLFSDEAGVVFVDLTREAVNGQSGSSSAEYASLAGLVRTVLTNFPETSAVQVLIDGEPATTLAGHFSIERPLSRSEWASP